MPRTNPRVEQLEQLERENAMLRKALEERRRDPGDLPVKGCGDNSCQVAQPRGMATNGGCRCEERELRRALQWYKRRAAFLEETIRTMREEA